MRSSFLRSLADLVGFGCQFASAGGRGPEEALCDFAKMVFTDPS